MTDRTIVRVGEAKLTLEGAGVRLKRGIAAPEAHLFDPFLMFDDFSSDIPEHYQAGFPWHPHRGMETVTYILDGAVRHKDSLGNEGIIEGGNVQWMTAGSGIIHEEMPESVHGIRGFQLWVNLPKEKKMSVPKYQDLTGKTIPEVSLAPGIRARVIAGELGGTKGPLEAIAGSPLYADLSLEAGREAHVELPREHTAFAYVVEGAAMLPGSEQSFQAGRVLLFGNDGEAAALKAGNAGARYLLIAGAPLKEPIAWHGPIVMNTEQELKDAFRELQEGTFIKR